MALPKRITRIVSRPLPLRLLALAVGAAAMLVARAMRRDARRMSSAAEAWSDVPSAPEWYVPNTMPGTVPDRLPIKRYDELRAVDIAKSVRQMENADEIQQVLDYEKEHHQRVTVFKAAKARLRALEAASH